MGALRLLLEGVRFDEAEGEGRFVGGDDGGDVEEVVEIGEDGFEVGGAGETEPEEKFGEEFVD